MEVIKEDIEHVRKIIDYMLDKNLDFNDLQDVSEKLDVLIEKYIEAEEITKIF